MSLIQDVKTKAKHRGMTPWQLVQKIRRLEREADARDCEMVAMATEIEELKAERTRLEGDFDEAAIDLSGAREDLQTANDEIAHLRRRLAPFLAAEANAHRVDVPAMHRIGCDQDTAPIEVTTLREAAAAGRLAAVTDPGRVYGEGVAS